MWVHGYHETQLSHVLHRVLQKERLISWWDRMLFWFWLDQHRRIVRSVVSGDMVTLATHVRDCPKPTSVADQPL